MARRRKPDRARRKCAPCPDPIQPGHGRPRGYRAPKPDGAGIMSRALSTGWTQALLASRLSPAGSRPNAQSLLQRPLRTMKCRLKVAVGTIHACSWAPVHPQMSCGLWMTHEGVARARLFRRMRRPAPCSHIAPRRERGKHVRSTSRTVLSTHRCADEYPDATPVPQRRLQIGPK